MPWILPVDTVRKKVPSTASRNPTTIVTSPRLSLSRRQRKSLRGLWSSGPTVGVVPLHGIRATSPVTYTFTESLHHVPPLRPAASPYTYTPQDFPCTLVPAPSETTLPHRAMASCQRPLSLGLCLPKVVIPDSTRPYSHRSHPSAGLDPAHSSPGPTWSLTLTRFHLLRTWAPMSNKSLSCHHAPPIPSLVPRQAHVVPIPTPAWLHPFHTLARLTSPTPRSPTCCRA